ncbi:DnaJ family domain-containing protein [Desulfocicer niacini]
MIPGFEKLVEQRIAAARQKGELDNLPGEGKPLNLEDMAVPEDFRMAYRVLKNAGFLPPEVQLRKEIENVESLLADLSWDAPERQALEKKLNFMLTRLNLSRGPNRKCHIPGDYVHRVIKKIL